MICYFHNQGIAAGGYYAVVKDYMLRDAVVFGLKPDTVYKDIIALRNALTFNQVYNLAKTE